MTRDNEKITLAFENFQKKVNNKCNALLNLVIGVQKFYKSSNDESKRFIETTVGAAIWYLPTSSFLFTGKISMEAIEKREKSADHLYPRKIAAREILEINWKNETDPVKKLSELYIKMYGKYNYVSKQEIDTFSKK